MEIRVKRVYDASDASDGTRILVDRLWPRGLTKARADVDLWLKEIAPTTDLRKWFAHDVAKWRRFRGRYHTELRHHSEEIAVLEREIERGRLTLLYGTRDQKHNEAMVLKHFMQQRSRSRDCVSANPIRCSSPPCSMPEIDATFATPINRQPLALGNDVVHQAKAV